MLGIDFSCFLLELLLLVLLLLVLHSFFFYYYFFFFFSPLYVCSLFTASPLPFLLISSVSFVRPPFVVADTRPLLNCCWALRFFNTIVPCSDKYARAGHRENATSLYPLLISFYLFFSAPHSAHVPILVFPLCVLLSIIPLYSMTIQLKIYGGRNQRDLLQQTVNWYVYLIAIVNYCPACLFQRK